MVTKVAAIVSVPSVTRWRDVLPVPVNEWLD